MCAKMDQNDAKKERVYAKKERVKMINLDNTRATNDTEAAIESQITVSYESIAKSINTALYVVVVIFTIINSFSVVFSFSQRIIDILYKAVILNVDVEYSNYIHKDISPNGYWIAKLVTLIFSGAVISFFIKFKNNKSVIKIKDALRTFLACAFMFLMFVYFCIGPVIWNIVNLLPTSSSIAFSMLIFALQCQPLFLEISATFSEESWNNITKVVGLASVFAILFYGCTGIFGYLAIGPVINYDSLLTVIFIKNSEVHKALIAKFGMGWGSIIPQIMCVSYVLMFVTGISYYLGLINDLIVNLAKAYNTVKKYAIIEKITKNRTYILAFCFMSYLMLGMIDVKGERSQDIILGLIGALCSLPLSFSMPALMYYLRFPEKTVMRSISLALFVVSIVVMIVLAVPLFMDLIANMNDDINTLSDATTSISTFADDTTVPIPVH